MWIYIYPSRCLTLVTPEKISLLLEHFFFFFFDNAYNSGLSTEHHVHGICPTQASLLYNLFHYTVYLGGFAYIF